MVAKNLVSKPFPFVISNKQTLLIPYYCISKPITTPLYDETFRLEFKYILQNKVVDHFSIAIVEGLLTIILSTVHQQG